MSHFIVIGSFGLVFISVIGLLIIRHIELCRSPAQKYKPGDYFAGSRYEIVEFLCESGMSTLFKAHDRKLDKMVAIKMLWVKSRRKTAPLRRKFRGEAQLLGRLKHPSLVCSFDHGVSAGQHYIVMEFLDGKTLAHEIGDLGYLPEPYALDICRQLCHALSVVHSSGLLHCDLKPGNIMLIEEGTDFPTVKLLDFGIAQTLCQDGETARSPHDRFYTKPYCSPEQEEGERLRLASDIYSLGCIIYECLTGKPPANWVEANASGKRLNTVLEGRPVSIALEGVVHKMLADNPSDRYQRADDVAADLPVWQFPTSSSANVA